MNLLGLSVLLLLASASLHPGAARAGDDLQLIGEWVSPCRPEAEDAQSQELQFAFNANGQVFMTARAYHGKECRAAPFFELLYLGAYAIHGPGEMDILVKQVAFTFHEPDLVIALNETQFCGISDWKLGVTRRVDDKTCEKGLDNHPLPPVYTIYKIKRRAGTKPTLFMGEDGTGRDGHSAATRHAALDSAGLVKK